MESNVSDNERLIALNFCKKFLGGAWASASDEQISINAVSGGMTNLLYRCALSDDVSLRQLEPRQVLLRIYGSSVCGTPVQVKIFNQLAAARLGPRLYSSFDEGRFEEYLPSNSLSRAQLVDDSISQVIARKIAAIHRLDVPELDKGPHWLTDQFHQMYETVELARERELEFNKVALDSTKNIAYQMMAINFIPEIEYLTRLIESSSASLVFSHNDLHQNNIILLNRTDLDPDDRVVLIDFEYCSYNHLTFDLANHLSEWCFDYNGDVYPNFNFSLDRFPSEDKQRQFIHYYVRGFSNHQLYREQLFGSGLSDSDIVDLLYNDMQTFLLASNLLWSIWAVRSALTSRIQFGYWEMSRCKWDVYMRCKREFQSKLGRQLEE